jgi:hypothetical protein
VVVAFLLALLIKAFLVQAFYIPSGSMQQTLEIRDRVLVNKLVYDFRDIRRGEVVVFNGLDSFTQETWSRRRRTASSGCCARWRRDRPRRARREGLHQARHRRARRPGRLLHRRQGHRPAAGRPRAGRAG